MNGNSDNHKPLSPEELFRLLETKNESVSPGDGLDDFEKEALEGFSAHASAEKARQLTEEVHQRIYEKLDGTKKKRPLGRIIWLGAAASVVLGLIISAYILTREASSSTELALNKEMGDDMKKVPPTLTVQEPETTIADSNPKEEKEMKPQLPARKFVASQAQGAVEESNQIAGDKNTYKKGAVNPLKDEAKKLPGKFDEDDMKLAETTGQEARKENMASNGAMVVNKAAAPKEDQIDMAAATDEKTQKQLPVATYESIEVTEKNSSRQRFKKSKEKEADAEKYPLNAVAATPKTEESKGPVGNNRMAYYTGYVGGDEGVKAYVMAWFKEHRYDAPRGNYTVRMKVMANGTAEVIKVKAGKQAEEKAVKPMEESLRVMKDWNPATSNEEATDLETTFILSF